MNNLVLGDAPVNQPVVACRKPEPGIVIPSEPAPKQGSSAWVEREEPQEVTGLLWPFFS